MNLTETLKETDLNSTGAIEQDTMSLLSSLRDSTSSTELRDEIDELEERISSFTEFKQNAIYHRMLIQQDLDCIVPEFKRSQKLLERAITELYRQDQLAALRMSPEELLRTAYRKTRWLAEVKTIE